MDLVLLWKARLEPICVIFVRTEWKVDKSQLVLQCSIRFKKKKKFCWRWFPSPWTLDVGQFVPETLNGATTFLVKSRVFKSVPNCNSVSTVCASCDRGLHQELQRSIQPPAETLGGRRGQERRSGWNQTSRTTPALTATPPHHRTDHFLLSALCHGPPKGEKGLISSLPSAFRTTSQFSWSWMEVDYTTSKTYLTYYSSNPQQLTCSRESKKHHITSLLL